MPDKRPRFKVNRSEIRIRSSHTRQDAGVSSAEFERDRDLVDQNERDRQQARRKKRKGSRR